MTDISKIPDKELETGLNETMADLGWCVFALAQGTKTYSDGKESVQDRKDANLRIAMSIMAEQDRRAQEKEKLEAL